MVPGKQFYADAERVTLKYTDSYILAQGVTGGTLSSLSYKLNSLFQVNNTASAGTPQGVASLTAKFSRYMVMGSRIHWRMRGLFPGGTMGALGVVGHAPTNSMLVSAVLYPLQSGGSAPTTIVGCAVQKYASKRFEWPRDVITEGGEASQLNARTVWAGRQSMTVKKLDADPDTRQAEYTAVFGADPSRLQYWVFSFQDVFADTAGKKAWFVEVEIEYDVYAFDRATVGDTLMGAPIALLTMKSEGKEEKSLASPTNSPVIVPRAFGGFLGVL